MIINRNNTNFFPELLTQRAGYNIFKIYCTKKNGITPPMIECLFFLLDYSPGVGIPFEPAKIYRNYPQSFYYVTFNKGLKKLCLVGYMQRLRQGCYIITNDGLKFAKEFQRKYNTILSSYLPGSV